MDIVRRIPEEDDPHLVTVTRWPNHAKEYVARITGAHPQYRFAREFCPVQERSWTRSGSFGSTTFFVTSPGYYEVSSPSTGRYDKEARSYWHFDGAAWGEISLRRLEAEFPVRQEEAAI